MDKMIMTICGGKQKDRDRELFRYLKAFRTWYHQKKQQEQPGQDSSSDELAQD